MLLVSILYGIVLDGKGERQLPEAKAKVFALEKSHLAVAICFVFAEYRWANCCLLTK